MSPSPLQTINQLWQQYKRDVIDEPRLAALKAFRDQLLCDHRFAAAFATDPASILAATNPRLNASDLSFFITPQQREKLGGCRQPSELALRLKQALGLDRSLRQHFMQASPRHRGWRSWRASQMQRFRLEDSSLRAAEITHIPFAIELTVGCSGSCSFCGLSAPPLERATSTNASSDPAFRELLCRLSNLCCDFGQSGVLYWATDPLEVAPL